VAERATVLKVRPLRELAIGDEDAARLLCLDGALFFARGVARTSRVLSRHAEGDIAAERRREGLFGHFLQGLAKAGLSGREPSNYYALIRADGDKIGVIFNRYADQAGTLSRALLQFSRGVEDIVSEHYGVTVFAGGDEFLALTPVDTAIGLAHRLRDLFRETIAAATGIDADMSAAIVFADYQLPLSFAVREVDTLLNNVAKDERSGNGRKSLAISVRGTPTPGLTWVSRWETTVRDSSPIWGESLRPGAVLDDLARHLAGSNALGQGWMHRVRRKLRPLLTTGGDATDTAAEAWLMGHNFEAILHAEMSRDAAREALPADELDRVAGGLAAASFRCRGTEEPLADYAAPMTAELEPGMLRRLVIELFNRLGRTGVSPPTQSRDANVPVRVVRGVNDLASLDLLQFLLREYDPVMKRSTSATPVMEPAR